MSKVYWVAHLPQADQDEIAVKIEKALKAMGYPEDEIKQGVEDALCSKIADIQETLNWEENEKDWGYGE